MRTGKSFAGMCVIVLLLSIAVLSAQDEVPPETKQGEVKLPETMAPEATTAEPAAPDSVKMIESMPETLSVSPLPGQPVLPEGQAEEELPQYHFKGTGRDIVIGAAVLTGWFVIAFLAANQRSE